MQEKKVTPGDSEKNSLVKTEKYKDFALSSFQVVINRIQQVALSKANCKVPCPEDQLALLRSKKGKEERLNLSYNTCLV